ncbi:MAG: type II secretion system minor pseudopilin GspK [Steroidobacteraceae bacterium]
MISRQRQRGVILMSALILVALAVVIAATLFFETAMSARRSVASFSMEQALQLGQGAEALAAYGLREDRNPDDSPLDPWAQPYGPVEVAPEVGLEALVTDEQGRFNVNTLLNADGTRNANAFKIFQRLLELCELEPKWASLLADWLDPNVLPEADGGEDSLYTSQKPPHLVGNLLVSSVSELQQLPGFTRELYLKLAPHITALPPTANTINVCTADGIVLDSLFALSARNQNNVQYSAQTPEALALSRKNGCFPKRAVLTANEQDMQARTGERSSYFRLHTWIRIGTAQFALYSLMYRDANGQARSIVRSFGTE